MSLRVKVYATMEEMQPFIVPKLRSLLDPKGVQVFTNVLCGPLLARAAKRGDKSWSMQSEGYVIAMDGGSRHDALAVISCPR